MERFSSRLKAIRTKKRVYQREVAEALGISVRAYQTYEAGEYEPSIANLIALADYFQVSTDYLLGRTDEPDDTKDRG